MDLLTIAEVLTATGLARRTLYRHLENGSFPSPVRIGNSRAVFFRAHEVSDWCAQHGIDWPARST